ncbi:MAG: LysM peptidoglycan-binding domain-containing protein [Acidimicrobiales bacterium]
MAHMTQMACLTAGQGPGAQRSPIRASPSLFNFVTVVAVAACLIVVVLAAWLGSGPTGEADVSGGVGVAQSSHVVQAGDTLWAIARRIQPGGDIRPLVGRLTASREAGPLMPGEVLVLP